MNPGKTTIGDFAKAIALGTFAGTKEFVRQITPEEIRPAADVLLAPERPQAASSGVDPMQQAVMDEQRLGELRSSLRLLVGESQPTRMPATVLARRQALPMTSVGARVSVPSPTNRG